MIEHGTVESTIKPEPLTIDEYSVWVAENITETTIENDVLYEYDLVQYTKDEYILQVALRDSVKTQAIMELSDMVATLMEG